MNKKTTYDILKYYKKTSTEHSEIHIMTESKEIGTEERYCEKDIVRRRKVMQKKEKFHDYLSIT